MKKNRLTAAIVWSYTLVYFFAICFCLYKTNSEGGNHSPFFGTWLDAFFGMRIIMTLAGVLPLFVWLIIYRQRIPLSLLVIVALVFFYYNWAYVVLSD